MLKVRWRPRLATVLFAANISIFLLPLSFIAILRLYESELIRRTETELNVQGAFVSAIYKTELERLFGSESQSADHQNPLSSYGLQAPEERIRIISADNPWTPIEATLDIARDTIHPPAPSPVDPDSTADISAIKAAERLTPVLLNARKTTLSAIRVMDYKGIVVASTRGDLGKSLLDQEEVRQALRGEHVSLMRERVGEGPVPPVDSISRGRSGIRVFVAMPVLEGRRIIGAVLLSRTPLDLSKALYLNRFYFLGGGTAILLVMVGVTVFTTLLITRPVKTLTYEAQQIAMSNKAAVFVPLDRPGTFEVDLLSKALAHMSETLQKRAGYIRTFASHVSHEFKTPLTSISGTVELLKDHFSEMSAEDRNRFLNILEEDANRLAKLVRRLLDLAKAEMAEPGPDESETAAILSSSADRFRSGGMNIYLDIPARVPSVAMAPELLESVVSNLIENARQHGGPSVNVHLTVRPVKNSGQEMVEITVKDDGPGVSEANSSRIFVPFFTTARQSGGTGLGLSIVQALVTAHQGTIALERTPSGALFRILLPASASGSPSK